MKSVYLSILVALVLLIALTYLSIAFYIANHAKIDTTKKSDAILVLGARSYIGGKYNPCLLARVQHAAALYKSQYAAKILVSGGDDREDGVNEAETMQKIALENGVKKQDILLEKRATSTYENFTYAKEILRRDHLADVIIVTEPFHIARAALVAKKLGYAYSVSPAADSPCWKENSYFSKYFLKEPLAMMEYKLQNKL